MGGVTEDRVREIISEEAAGIKDDIVTTITGIVDVKLQAIKEDIVTTITGIVDVKLNAIVARFDQLPKQTEQACPITEVIIRVGSAEQVKIAGRSWEPCPPVTCCNWQPEYPKLDEKTQLIAELIEEKIGESESELFPKIGDITLKEHFGEEIVEFAESIGIVIPLGPLEPKEPA